MRVFRLAMPLEVLQHHSWVFWYFCNVDNSGQRVLYLYTSNFDLVTHSFTLLASDDVKEDWWQFATPKIIDVHLDIVTLVKYRTLQLLFWSLFYLNWSYTHLATSMCLWWIIHYAHRCIQSILGWQVSSCSWWQLFTSFNHQRRNLPGQFSKCLEHGSYSLL
jgi:hypothetical protein